MRNRPKIKKTNTAKRKEKRKKAEQRLAEEASAMMNHPTECCVCKQAFVRDHETVKTWMVTVMEETKVVYLTCPPCWSGVVEIAERKKNDED